MESRKALKRRVYRDSNGSLPDLDETQSALIEEVVRGHNAVVNCVPGSGKTTCALHMAARMPERTFWIITYNRDLKNDTQTKLRKLGLNNCLATNYHGFCCAY